MIGEKGIARFRGNVGRGTEKRLHRIVRIHAGGGAVSQLHFPETGAAFPDVISDCLRVKIEYTCGLP